MNISIPVYVEHYRDESPARMVYRCEPLFFPVMNGRDENLARATGKLLKHLKPHVDSLGAMGRHDRLAAFAFNPACETRLLKLSLDLRDRIARTTLLFVEMRLLERTVAFSPSIPELWFDLKPGQNLKERAEEVLSLHFREQAKLSRSSNEAFKVAGLTGQAWVTVLDVEVTSGQIVQNEMHEKLASLFDSAKMHGATELNRVGRCLDWLYPDDLKRAILREREVGELKRLLSGDDRRPVLLVGPSLVGKTTVVHEFVHRRVARRKRPYSARRNVWLLSPQRLISGMSYVGQWENRVLAILKEARHRDHVLYFDDMLGLYQAGISSDSKLCVADVLRSYVLRREVRVVGELTPEANSRQLMVAASIHKPSRPCSNSLAAISARRLFPARRPDCCNMWRRNAPAPRFRETRLTKSFKPRRESRGPWLTSDTASPARTRSEACKVPSSARQKRSRPRPTW
jgi:hypothetical protein